MTICSGLKPVKSDVTKYPEFGEIRYSGRYSIIEIIR